MGEDPLPLRLALIGLSGAGKSAVAGLVAARLAATPVDLDVRVERGAGRSAAELFACEGEVGFREREARTLEAALDEAPVVIACGGGVVESTMSREQLRRAFVVWLRVDPEEAARRLGADGLESRPLLAGAGGAEERTARLRALLARREALYTRAADAIVGTGGRSVEEVSDLVVKLWHARGLDWASSES